MRPLLLPLLFVSVVAAAAVPPSPAQARARRFLINFAANRLDRAANDFNEQMKATVTPEVLTRFKEQFDSDYGHFLSVTSVQEGTEGEFPVVELTARFERASAVFQVAFDAAGKIGALHFDRVPDNNPELERIGREVLQAFNARRFDDIGKHLDVKMSAQLPPAALEALYRDVTAIYGKFKAVTEVHYATQRDLRIVNIFADYEKAPMLFEVVFNGSRRVVGWSFRPPPKAQ